MSCYICGGPIAEPKLDPRDMKIRPCATCERIVHENVESFHDEFDPDGTFVVSLETDIEEFYGEVYSPDGRNYPAYQTD